MSHHAGLVFALRWRRGGSPVLAALLVLGASLAPAAWGAVNPLTYEPIAALHQAIAAGSLSSETLVKFELARIAALNHHGPDLNAVIAVNPDALAEARALDKARGSEPRGPLYGIPVLIKDNIETQDRMPTTAGSYALANNYAVHDAQVVAALRAAGAVILGKANLSEWANYRSTHSTSGWSALGGLTRNPYVLDRTACGSSSGSAAAVAAGLAPASVGTETDGSIVCPASMNGIVGLKPTVGLLSQRGLVPVAHSQDTAGPMARSVEGVALLLTAMLGQPARCAAPAGGCRISNYLAALKASALQGKRIGVLRFEPGAHPELDVVYRNALARLEAAGATLVDVDAPDLEPIAAAESTVLSTEFKVDLDGYLAGANPAVPVHDLAQLIRFNLASLYEMELFGQDLFVAAERTSGVDDPRYRAALAAARRLAGAEGIDRLLREQHLDLLVALTAPPAWRVDILYGDRKGAPSALLPAVAGYPDLTVPMGEVDGLPVGLSFIGPAWSEALLLACGYAFEQRTPPLDPPTFIPSLEGRELGPGSSEY
ncbi:MAG: amidase [Steroidobacteraceae bacterium]